MHEMARLKPSPPNQIMKAFKRKDANTTSTSNDFTYFGRSIKGEAMLIKAIAAHLDDYFLGNILGIVLEKIFKKSFLVFLKNCTIFLKFVLKICQKYVIFKNFQIHLQVLLLFKNTSNGCMDITLLLKVQMVIK
jgi:hypothetical protein